MRNTCRTFLASGAAAVALFALGPAPALSQEKTADVQFRDAYKTVQLADAAYEREDWSRARQLYSQAVETYNLLRTRYPDWQPGVVDFRIRYCTRRIDTLPSPEPDETEAVIRARPEPPPQLPPPPPAETVPSPAERKAAQALRNLVDASRRQLLAGNASSARDSLIAAMKISPDNETIRLLLAFAQCQLGQFTAAATMLDNLIEDNPSSAEAYLYRGMARMGLGRVSDAVADMQQSVVLNPASRDAHYDLAQALLLKSPPDTSGALRHYRKSIELGGPEDPDLADRLKQPTRSP